jgi:hypothetical protein
MYKTSHPRGPQYYKFLRWKEKRFGEEGRNKMNREERK